MQPCPTHARKPWDRTKRQPGGNGWQWQRIRRAILARDGHTCRYCHAIATQIDHVVPIARGGSDDPTNLVACCARCNEQRRRRLVAGVG